INFADYVIDYLSSGFFLESESFPPYSIKYDEPGTVCFLSNNMIVVTNAGVKLPDSKNITYCTRRFRWTGNSWLPQEKQEKLSETQVFAGLGYEDLGLSLDSFDSGAMRVIRFDPRRMVWSDTDIVGSAMSDWDLAWKIILDVFNIILLPLSFIPFK